MTDDGLVLASAEVAADRKARNKGLLGRDGFEGAFVVEGCRWIHTFGMRFPLDVAYLDEQGNVVESCSTDKACYAGACIPACEAVAKLEGTVGCDFWAPTPPFTQNGENTAIAGPCGSCFCASR